MISSDKEVCTTCVDKDKIENPTWNIIETK